MTYEESIGIAARIWCDPEMSSLVMNPELAMKIAEMLRAAYPEGASI